jgi:hypothetical protein
MLMTASRWPSDSTVCATSASQSAALETSAWMTPERLHLVGRGFGFRTGASVRERDIGAAPGQLSRDHLADTFAASEQYHFVCEIHVRQMNSR